MLRTGLKNSKNKKFQEFENVCFKFKVDRKEVQKLCQFCQSLFNSNKNMPHNTSYTHITQFMTFHLKISAV